MVFSARQVGSALRGGGRWTLAMVASVGAWPAGMATAQMPIPRDQLAGIMADPCPPPLERPAAVVALQKEGPAALFGSKDRAVVAFLQEENRRRGADRAGLCRYRHANEAFASGQAPQPRVVFIGDSITDFWPGLDAGFFDGNAFTGRGIGAQVTAQGLLRFQQDVVEVRPKVVHILFGTNDIAGLAGPTTLARVQANLIAMVQLARVNGIGVVVSTIPPITHLPGGARVPDLDARIVEMNAWIRDYAKREGIAVADYYPALSDKAGGFKSELNSDGVHPTIAGYRVMEPIALKAIQTALARAQAPRSAGAASPQTSKPHARHS